MKLDQDKSIMALVNRIKALKVSLKALDSSYEKLVRNLVQVLTKSKIDNRQEEMNKLNKELNNVLNNEKIITEELKALSTNINGEVLQKVKLEQDKIRREYRSFGKGLNIAFGLDGKPIKSDDKDIYDSLCLLNELLSEPLNDMEVIGEMVAVNKDRKEQVLELLKKVGFISKIEKEENIKIVLSGNDKLILELENYLDGLAKKISNYEEMAGLPIRETKQIEDKKWVVLESDVEECNLIIEIMKILKLSLENTVRVWDIAEIRKDLIDNFKKYVNGTKYFADLVPKIAENEIEINNIKKRLGELIKKAKNNNSTELILSADKREYELLNKKYCYLVSAQAGDNLVPYAGVMLEPKYVTNYQDVEKELQMIRNNDRIRQENANNELTQKRIQKRVLEFNNTMANNLELARINKEQDV